MSSNVRTVVIVVFALFVARAGYCAYERDQRAKALAAAPAPKQTYVPPAETLPTKPPQDLSVFVVGAPSVSDEPAPARFAAPIPTLAELAANEVNPTVPSLRAYWGLAGNVPPPEFVEARLCRGDEAMWKGLRKAVSAMKKSTPERLAVYAFSLSECPLACAQGATELSRTSSGPWRHYLKGLVAKCGRPKDAVLMIAEDVDEADLTEWLERVPGRPFSPALADAMVRVAKRGAGVDVALTWAHVIATTIPASASKSALKRLSWQKDPDTVGPAAKAALDDYDADALDGVGARTVAAESAAAEAALKALGVPPDGNASVFARLVRAGRAHPRAKESLGEGASGLAHFAPLGGAPFDSAVFEEVDRGGRNHVFRAWVLGKKYEVACSLGMSCQAAFALAFLNGIAADLDHEARWGLARSDQGTLGVVAGPQGLLQTLHDERAVMLVPAAKEESSSRE